MFQFKKDWLYTAKILYSCFVLVQICFSVLGIIFSGHQLPLIILSEIYNSFYQISIIFILIYPAFVLKMLSPRRSHFFDAALLTANLPYTQKALFWMSIKHWLYLAPLYLLAQTGISYFLQVIQLGEDKSSFFTEMIFNNLFLILIMMALVFQCLAAIIRLLAYDLKWYVVTPTIVIGNLLYLFIGIALFEYVNPNYTIPQLLIIILPLILISLILFLTNLKHIEKIWR